MCIRHVLVALLFAPICVVPLVAQSSPDKGAVSSRPVLEGPILYRDSRLHIPKLLQQAQSGSRVDQLQMPSEMVTLAQNDGPCFSMRSYRFTRVNPKSDATKFSGYSTCQPAARVHLKDAGERGQTPP